MTDISPYVAEAAASKRSEAEARAPLHPVMVQALRGFIPDEFLPPRETYIVETLDDGAQTYPDRGAAISAMAQTFEVLRVIRVSAGERTDISAEVAADYVESLYRAGWDMETILADGFAGRHLTNDQIEQICEPEGWK